ncbi:MAG: hypothetical protein WD138_02325, partial [Halofilum sp. (in: g-proteobacteria)]
LALVILAVLLALTALVGGLVALKPDWLQRLRAATDRRYTLRPMTRPLDTPRNIDPLLYRHHKAYGLVVMTLAAFLLYFLAFGEQRVFWRELFPPDYREAAGIVADVARLVLWIFSVFALTVGTVVLARPSALKGLEARVNRWFTGRSVSERLDREYDWLDERLGRNPRLWGWVTLVASVICLAALLVQWQALRLAG